MKGWTIDMKCSKCGSDIRDGATFCGVCGEKIADSNTDAAKQKNETEQQMTKRTPVFNKKIVSMAGVLLAVIIAVAIIPYLIRQSQVSKDVNEKYSDNKKIQETQTSHLNNQVIYKEFDDPEHNNAVSTVLNMDVPNEHIQLNGKIYNIPQKVTYNDIFSDSYFNQLEWNIYEDLHPSGNILVSFTGYHNHPQYSLFGYEVLFLFNSNTQKADYIGFYAIAFNEGISKIESYMVYVEDARGIDMLYSYPIGERSIRARQSFISVIIWDVAQELIVEATNDNTSEYLSFPNEIKLGTYYSDDGNSTIILSEGENENTLHFELSLYRIGAWGGSIFLTKQNEFSFSAKSHQNDMEIVEGIISFNRDKIIFNVVKGDSLLAPGGRSFVYVDTNDSIDNLITVTTDTFLDYADGYWGRKNTTGGWDILCFENGKMCDYTYAGAIWMWDGTVEEIEMISDNTFDVKISYQEIVYGDEDEIADSYKVTYTFKIEGGPKKILIIPDANIEYVYTYVGKTQEALEAFVKIND